jgi:murein DD-endopeptidase MepM/ murein hydrolase activator NlpD
LYNVSIETITNNNTIDSQGLKSGQDLQIPCTDAIIYTIKAGDTLESVSNRYKLDVITISSLNSESISKDGFKEGNEILIPGISFEDYNQINSEIAQKDAKTLAESKALKAQEEKLDKQLQDNKKLISDAKNRAEENNVNLDASSCGLIWPTTTKNISQYPSKSHMALDIANRSKPDIFAAANGKVVYAGWDNTGYGNMILIDHGNGMKTRYAHNTQLYVSVGDYVTQGQSIAQMGATGHVYGATGIHLHFEVIQNGKLTNPLSCY